MNFGCIYKTGTWVYVSMSDVFTISFVHVPASLSVIKAENINIGNFVGTECVFVAVCGCVF